MCTFNFINLKNLRHKFWKTKPWTKSCQILSPLVPAPLEDPGRPCPLACLVVPAGPVCPLSLAALGRPRVPYFPSLPGGLSENRWRLTFSVAFNRREASQSSIRQKRSYEVVVKSLLMASYRSFLSRFSRITLSGKRQKWIFVIELVMLWFSSNSNEPLISFFNFPSFFF